MTKRHVDAPPRLPLEPDACCLQHYGLAWSERWRPGCCTHGTLDDEAAVRPFYIGFVRVNSLHTVLATGRQHDRLAAALYWLMQGVPNEELTHGARLCTHHEGAGVHITEADGIRWLVLHVYNERGWDVTGSDFLTEAREAFFVANVACNHTSMRH